MRTQPSPYSVRWGRSDSDRDHSAPVFTGAPSCVETHPGELLRQITTSVRWWPFRPEGLRDLSFSMTGGNSARLTPRRCPIHLPALSPPVPPLVAAPCQTVPPRGMVRSRPSAPTPRTPSLRPALAGYMARLSLPGPRERSGRATLRPQASAELQNRLVECWLHQGGLSGSGPTAAGPPDTEDLQTNLGSQQPATLRSRRISTSPCRDPPERKVRHTHRDAPRRSCRELCRCACTAGKPACTPCIRGCRHPKVSPTAPRSPFSGPSPRQGDNPPSHA